VTLSFSKRTLFLVGWLVGLGWIGFGLVWLVGVNRPFYVVIFW